MPELTHEVFNQPEPLVDRNLFALHRPLQDGLRFNAPGLDTAPLSRNTPAFERSAGVTA